MSIEETNRAIVLRNFRSFDSGDLRTLEETTAPGFIDHNPLESQLPGVKGTMQASAIYRTAFPDAEIAVEDTIAEADKVVIRWSGSATHKGPFLDVPPLSLIHISEPTRRTPISYAVFCLKKKKK